SISDRAGRPRQSDEHHRYATVLQKTTSRRQASARCCFICPNRLSSRSLFLAKISRQGYVNRHLGSISLLRLVRGAMHQRGQCEDKWGTSIPTLTRENLYRICPDSSYVRNRTIRFMLL